MLSEQGISRATMYRILQRYQEYVTTETYKQPGRPAKNNRKSFQRSQCAQISKSILLYIKVQRLGIKAYTRKRHHSKKMVRLSEPKSMQKTHQVNAIIILLHENNYQLKLQSSQERNLAESSCMAGT